MIHSLKVLVHIAVTVSDMDRSLAFYRDLLGLQQVETPLLEGDTISKMAGKPGVVMKVVRLAAPESPAILLDRVGKAVWCRLVQAGGIDRLAFHFAWPFLMLGRPCPHRPASRCAS